MLLAIDPGANSPGVALYTAGDAVLRHAARILVPSDYAKLPDGQRWLLVGKLVAYWAMQRANVTHVVFERPQWYARAKSKGDPNQLAGVAGVAMGAVGLLEFAKPGGQLIVHSPKPAEWIGQLSKACGACGALKKKCLVCGGSVWKTPRGHRIRSRLTEAERALVPDQNDAVDAVGLGLWALGRLTPRSVLSNGHDGR